MRRTPKCFCTLIIDGTHEFYIVLRSKLGPNIKIVEKIRFWGCPNPLPHPRISLQNSSKIRKIKILDRKMHFQVFGWFCVMKVIGTVVPNIFLPSDVQKIVRNHKNIPKYQNPYPPSPPSHSLHRHQKWWKIPKFRFSNSKSCLCAVGCFVLFLGFQEPIHPKNHKIMSRNPKNNIKYPAPNKYDFEPENRIFSIFDHF